MESHCGRRSSEANHRSGRPFEGRSGNSVGPAQLLMTFDVNNDDRISAQELSASPMPRLVQFTMMKNGDKKKDDFIDAAEREELQASMKGTPGEVIGRKNAGDRPIRPPVLRTKQPESGIRKKPTTNGRHANRIDSPSDLTAD